METITAVYFVGFIRRINSYNASFAKTAFIFVQISFIAPTHSPHHPALRTKSRRRDFDFFVEIKILRLNGKVLFTVLTDFGFEHNFNKWTRFVVQFLLFLQYDDWNRQNKKFDNYQSFYAIYYPRPVF